MTCLLQPAEAAGTSANPAATGGDSPAAWIWATSAAETPGSFPRSRSWTCDGSKCLCPFPAAVSIGQQRQFFGQAVIQLLAPSDLQFRQELTAPHVHGREQDLHALNADDCRQNE